MKQGQARWSSAVMMLAIAFTVMFCSVNRTLAQSLGPFDKDRGHTMLKVLKDDIKKNYYDTKYHNVDLEARFKEADEKINQASSNSQIMGIIAQTLIDFNDSHTFFLPPSRTASIEYGWQMAMIGDKCYVVSVKPGSDADTKEVKAGDQILAINGFTPTRGDLWKMQYSYNVLRPQPALRLALLSPDGKQRQVDVMSKITPGKQIVNLDDYDEVLNLVRKSESDSYYNRHRFVTISDEVLVWKMPEFDLSEEEVDKAMSKAKNAKSLILDLRGNPGGAVLTLQRLVGHFFDHDVKIGVEQGRKDGKPLMAKTRGDKAFKGKLVVLIDSRSASCSEIFARTMQLENRGTVIGDTSAGAVMISIQHGHQLGTETVVFYGCSVTHFDMIMNDGKSLEKVGVTPDEKIVPNAFELAAGHDPVLSRASIIAGKPVEAAKAGTFFPIEWKKDK